MATDKTPTYKRISRAEKSASTWKMKAIERREENEQLQSKLAAIEAKVASLTTLVEQYSDLQKQVKLLSNQLQEAHQIIVNQQNEINELKKKARR